MTVDEKRKILNEFCERSSCTDCMLNTGDWKKAMDILGCLKIMESGDEEDLDKAINIINGWPVDSVNHPSHYCTGKYECIDVMLETQGVEAVKSFCICNAFKYLYRHNGKNALEDIKKAKWYIDKYIELEEGE